jgi:hypothetical protein
MKNRKVFGNVDEGLLSPGAYLIVGAISRPQNYCGCLSRSGGTLDLRRQISPWLGSKM